MNSRIMEQIVDEAKGHLAELDFLEENVDIKFLSSQAFDGANHSLEMRKDESLSGLILRSTFDYVKYIQQDASLNTVGVYSRPVSAKGITPTMLVRIPENDISPADYRRLVINTAHELTHAWAAENALPLRDYTRISDFMASLEFIYGDEAAFVERHIQRDRMLFPRNFYGSGKLPFMSSESKGENINYQFGDMIGKIIVGTEFTQRWEFLKMREAFPETMTTSEEREGLRKEREILEEVNDRRIRMNIALKKHEELKASIEPLKKPALYFNEGLATYIQNIVAAHLPLVTESPTPQRQYHADPVIDKMLRNRIKGDNFQNPYQAAIRSKMKESYDLGVRFFEAIESLEDVHTLVTTIPNLESFYALFTNHATEPQYSVERGFLDIKASRQSKAARRWMESLRPNSPSRNSSKALK